MMYSDIFYGIMLPLLGTSIGSLVVFFISSDIKPSTRKYLFSLSSGIMLAATVWSLVLPALEYSRSYGVFCFIPVCVGIFLGYGLMVLFNSFSDNIDDYSNKKINRFIYAVTLHNIPEGMAVGVAYATVLYESSGYNFSNALILAIGISIQNIPEGSIISLPLYGLGFSKKKSFLYGFLSGVVEPIAGALALIICSFIKALLPYFLSIAAGTMIFVIIRDMIPDFYSENKYILCFLVGFNIMMVLDVVFG